MTDQQIIDALVKRVQDGAALDHRDIVAHLAGLLDQPTPERRAAALAALDLPQEPS